MTTLPRAAIVGAMLLVPLCAGTTDSAVCALTAYVQDAKGAPVSRTWVELFDQRSTVVFSGLVDSNPVRICDFGFGTHTLRVGRHGCFPVTVSNLQFMFAKPIVLRIVLNACVIGDMWFGCPVYFRIRSVDNQKLANIKIVSEQRSTVTDAYGRAQFMMGTSTTETFVFEGQGYEAARQSVSCRDRSIVEREIILERSPRP